MLDYCPRVSAGEEPSCVLHDRGLSAVTALGLFAVESKLKVAVAGVVCSLTFHSLLYLVQSFMFMYVMWGVPNIQDRADWGGQAWLFQIIHVLCVLKVLARHPSADPRFAQSNERAYESHATRSHSLRARTTPSIVCETSADSLVNVSEASARSEFYTHALAMLRARARVLARRSRAEYTVRVLARYALRSLSRNLASVHQVATSEY